MSNRKDNKGRKFRSNEGQRKDGAYYYRYIDGFKNRKTVYANTLKELREKEDEIQQALRDGVLSSSNLTVLELAQQYVAMRESAVRCKTHQWHEGVLRKLKADPFSTTKIQDVTFIMAKQWMSSRAQLGESRYIINNLKNVLHPAFQMALEDGLVAHNPFEFRLDRIIPPGKKKNREVSQADFDRLMEFVKSSPTYSKYYDMFYVLAETGIRAGEVCGLIVDDVDFQNHCIHVVRQVQQTPNRGLFIEYPKSNSGIRDIPMDSELEQRMEKIIAQPRSTIKVDGVGGFLFTRKNGNPMMSGFVSNIFERAVAAYNADHPDPLPTITPHMFRHKFCSDLVTAGVNIKTAQYVMGHSRVDLTLNVYAHVNYSEITKDFLGARKRIGTKMVQN